MTDKSYKPGFFENMLIQMVISRLGLKKLLGGKKTYIVGAMMVLNGIYALVVGEVPTYGNPDPVSANDAWNMIGIGSGFMTGRAGVQKLQTAVENGNGGN